jgi:hypothetical protein
MVKYEAIYGGANDLLNPNYGSTGYHVPAGSLGATTSIQTANQLGEVSKLLNQGMKRTEVSVIKQDVFEMMSDEQLREIRRLNELTGANSTLHAPIIDPAGSTEQGWSEENRALAERQFSQIMERAHILDKKGNMPVTIHASAGLPGSQYVPTKEGEQLQMLIAVDRKTGKPLPIKRELKFYPGMEKPIEREPLKELQIANESYWDNQLSELLVNKEKADNLFQNAQRVLGENDIQVIQQLPSLPKNVQQEYWNVLSPEQKTAVSQIQNAQSFLESSYQSMLGVFNDAYKFSDDNQKERLKELSKNFGENIKKTGYYTPEFAQEFQNLITDMRSLTSGENAPQIYQKVEDFTIQNASKTLGNVAMNSYKKFGENAPIISIENPPYGSAISTGEDLKNLVVASRKQFENQLVSQGTSPDEAKKIAGKIIGATWDTSHISMIRNQGYGKEKITEETKKVAPFVKHVHYNDNLGSTHTDLPPGMGDVPMKDVLEVLEKQKFKGSFVFEGGNFFQSYQTSPHPYVLAGSGSPLYSMELGPYWNQLGGFGGYANPIGEINPQIHHSLYGAGMANLPTELGGQIAGNQSRFSGTPNQ